MANKFYQALDHVFNLDYGKNLLATSSRAQLQDMINKDYPFFMNHKVDVHNCLNNMSCQIVENIVENLGKNSYDNTFINHDLLSQVLQEK